MIPSLRRETMMLKDSKIIYQANNLICDGTNAFDTGFAPFSAENIDKPFRITLRIKEMKAMTNKTVVLGCKYEGTINGIQWPGLYVRVKSNTVFDVGGSDYWQASVDGIVGKNLRITRFRDGLWYANVDEKNNYLDKNQKKHYILYQLTVDQTEFNQNIVIGAGVQTNGTLFRYSQCDIDYVRIEYL